METVARHGTQPLADEFRRAVEKVKLGLAVPVALRGMARRVDLPDFNIFVAAVTLHRTVGGNLTLLLDRIAASVRDRNMFRGYVAANTALSHHRILHRRRPPAAVPGISDLAARIRPGVLAKRRWHPPCATALILEIIGAIWMFYLLRMDY